MADKNGEKGFQITARALLILLIALPVLLLIVREISYGGTIWHFRIVDLGDMLILSPVYAIILVFLWLHMLRSGVPNRLLLFFLGFAILFMFGQAMHVTGNSINTFATEVNNYKPILPEDLYELIYFLDEELSHLILVTAVTGLMICYLAFDRLAIASPLLPETPIISVVLGGLYGFILAYGLIEAQFVWFMFPMLLLMIAFWLWYWRKSGLSFGGYLSSRPYTRVFGVVILATILTTVGYGLLFGGFPQPSEIGL